MKTDLSGGTNGHAQPRDLSTAELVKEIARESRELVKTQVDLAKAELRADLAHEKTTIAGLGVAALAGLIGVTLLLVTAILALAKVMPAWLAGLVVSGFVLLVAGVAGWIGWKRRVREPLARTRHALKEDVRWTKERLA
jgi:uncharacterized membrane protein YqjE